MCEQKTPLSWTLHNNRGHSHNQFRWKYHSDNHCFPIHWYASETAEFIDHFSQNLCMDTHNIAEFMSKITEFIELTHLIIPL